MRFGAGGLTIEVKGRRFGHGIVRATQRGPRQGARFCFLRKVPLGSQCYTSDNCDGCRCQKSPPGISLPLWRLGDNQDGGKGIPFTPSLHASHFPK